MSKIVDAQGNDIKTKQVPAVHWNDFVIPIRTVTKEQFVDFKSSVSPAEVIQEVRAGYLEMQDRFVLLATGLSLVAKQNPGGEMDKYLSQMGLVLVDMNGKKIYEPNPELQTKQTVKSDPQQDQSVSAE